MLPEITAEKLIGRFGIFDDKLSGLAEQLNAIVHAMTAIKPDNRDVALGEVRDQLRAMLPVARAIEEGVRRILMTI